MSSMKAWPCRCSLCMFCSTLFCSTLMVWLAMSHLLHSNELSNKLSWRSLWEGAITPTMNDGHCTTTSYVAAGAVLPHINLMPCNMLKSIWAGAEHPSALWPECSLRCSWTRYELWGTKYYPLYPLGQATINARSMSPAQDYMCMCCWPFLGKCPACLHVQASLD